MIWQAILVAEGFLPLSEIDGQFGPITANATVQWQQRYQIGVDGQVGNQTWTTADNRLFTQLLVNGHWVFYRGSGQGDVGFYRGNENTANLDGGAYQLNDVTTPAGDRRNFGGGIRIQHFSKTITGPSLVARSAESRPAQ